MLPAVKHVMRFIKKYIRIIDTSIRDFSQIKNSKSKW